jgi:hypothetical protein
VAKSLDTIDYGRLIESMRRSRQILQHTRRQRYELAQQYAGQLYSEAGPPQPVPVNLLALYVSIVHRALFSKNPRVMLSTFQRQHRATVQTMQLWSNEELETIDFAGTLERVVLDALFCVGIVKSSLVRPGDSAMTGFQTKAGEPMVQRVDLDDWAFDPHCRDLGEAGWMAHRFRIPKAAAEADYGRKKIKDLEASTDRPQNAEGDDRLTMLFRGNVGTIDEFEDMIDLWEVYLPRHQKIITLCDADLAGPSQIENGEHPEALDEKSWIGPRSGPYKILAYSRVPGNPMPIGPLMQLLDLHHFANSSYRKLMRQTRDFKKITAARSGTLDGKKILDANDGDMVPVDDPNNIKDVVTGGPDQQVFAMFMEAMKLFKELGGNLDMMGGLGPQSRTATQDTMLEKNASRSLADMQERTVKFTAECVKSMCWFWHNDPYKTIKTKYQVPGLPHVFTNLAVTPEQRQRIPWEDLKIKIDPYSIRYSTPEARLQGLNAVVQQVILPMLPLLRQSGKNFNVDEYLQKVAGYLDLPDLIDLVNVSEPPDQETVSGPEQPKMPQNTQRSYERISSPGRTERGDQQTLIAGAMGMDRGGASERNGNGQY